MYPRKQIRKRRKCSTFKILSWALSSFLENVKKHRNKAYIRYSHFSLQNLFFSYFIPVYVSGIIIETCAETHVHLPVKCHLPYTVLIEIWIRGQMLVKVSNIKYYKSVQWFYTWRIDTIELTAPVAIFFSKHVKNRLFPIEKSVFAGSRAVTASETTVMDFWIPLTALAVSLFPSLSYFMTYFKCVIT